MAKNQRTSSRRATKKGFLEPHGRVLLYVPNLIGYARIGLVGIAFSMAFRRPEVFLSAYVLAFVCDDLDGRAARAFQQCSAFGAVLDMATDRLSTTGLAVLLAALLPDVAPLLAGLAALDVGSHWLRTAAANAQGAHHKSMSASSSPRLLSLYYRSRIFMGYCCVSAEIGYLALYAVQWPILRGPVVPAEVLDALASYIAGWLPLGGRGPTVASAHATLSELLLLLSIPGWALKQIVNVLQAFDAACALGSVPNIGNK